MERRETQGRLQKPSRRWWGTTIPVIHSQVPLLNLVDGGVEEEDEESSGSCDDGSSLGHGHPHTTCEDTGHHPGLPDPSFPTKTTHKPSQLLNPKRPGTILSAPRRPRSAARGTLPLPLITATAGADTAPPRRKAAGTPGDAQPPYEGR